MKKRKTEYELIKKENGKTVKVPAADYHLIFKDQMARKQRELLLLANERIAEIIQWSDNDLAVANIWKELNVRTLGGVERTIRHSGAVEHRFSIVDALREVNERRRLADEAKLIDGEVIEGERGGSQHR